VAGAIPSPGGCSNKSNISDAKEFLGAKLGANDASCQATPGHTQPESPQVNSPQGDVWRRRAMGWACMACKRSGVRIPIAPRFFVFMFEFK
jgi:hypothetical protein